ncbi:MAG: ribonuclease H-like domain-containing protein [Planctomycetes bacterium]|nr:ribonuclease H-like domain-containing protein [Planctomycetota bacterium]
MPKSDKAKPQPEEPQDPKGDGGRGLLSRAALDRLLQLNRTKLSAHLTTADQLERRDRGRQAGRAPGGAGQATDLPSLCPGRAVETPHGSCYVIERTLGEIDPAQAGLDAEYHRTFLGGAMNVTEESLHRSVRPLIAALPQGIAYLDIETCGMLGMPCFLAGLLVWRDERLVLVQVLARDYHEERAMLDRTWAMMDQVSTLVTFNGLSFDVPYIEDRAAATGLGLRSLKADHVDLLHESRRRWRGMLPNCRLQTLERFICGRLRRGDIPGDQIPSVYHEYVRTADARQMQVVLHHNALDLLTLAELTVCILQGREADGL